MDKEKIVWITGASTGIGKALALEFVKNGKNVAASARRGGLLDELKKESGSGNLVTGKLDISDNSQIEKTAAEINADYDIDCLINNAGVTTFTPAEQDSKEEIKKIIETNLIGSVNVIKTVLPGMINRGGGTIINILSVAAVKVFTNSSAYAASKAGLLAYTNVLREELRDKNIRIVNVLPGATKTPIWPGEALEKFSHRMMKPADIAAFLYKVYTAEGNMVPEEIVLKPVKGDL